MILKFNSNLNSVQFYDAPAQHSVNEMIYQESASMAYKAVINQAPISLTTLFNRASSVTKRSLRKSELNIAPLRFKKMRKIVFAYRGTMVRNSLPSDCKKANSFHYLRLN